jgi:4-amino-4-deoxy-L-arabinose transferase-like glycosyltransferase
MAVGTDRTAFPRLVWLAIAAGLVARLAFGLGYWVDQPLTHDEREYLLLGRSLAEGRGFTYTAADGSPLPGEHFGRAPVYPAFLGALIRTVPGAAADHEGEHGPPVTTTLLRAVRVVQAVLGAAGIWLIARWARGAAGPRAAAAAAWIAACYPPLVWTPAYMFSETLFTLLALVTTLVLAPRDAAPAAWTPGAGRGLLAGLLAGLGILTRPSLLFFLPLAALWLWWRRARAAAVLLVVGSLVVLAPWSYRNTVAYGRFVLVASEGGITFWTGNHPLAVGDGDMAANPSIKRANVALRARHPGLTPEEMEPIYYREAIDWILREPVAWLKLMGAKAYYTVVPTGPSYQLHSARYRWASVIPLLAVMTLAVAGAWRIGRRGRWPVPLLLLAASAVLVGLVFFPQERYRIPVLDPTLIVLAAGVWLGPGQGRRV